MSGRGHIRKRSKDSWEVTVELPRTSDGKRRQRTKTIRGRKSEAIEWLNDELARLKGGLSIAPSKMTLGEYLDWWLERHRESLSPTTADGYRLIIEPHIKRTWREKFPEDESEPDIALGDVRLQDLTWEHLEDYYSRYREQYQRGDDGDFVYVQGERVIVRARKLSEQSLKNHHRLIRKALKDAVKTGHIARNPADSARSPSPKGRKQVRPFPLTKNRELFERFDGDMRVFVKLALATGMRRSELLGLKWDAVHGSEVHVCRSLVLARNRAILRDEVKTSTSNRRITLPPALVVDLKALRVRQAEAKLAAGEAYEDRGFVFANALGGHWHPTMVTREFKEGVSGSEFALLDVHSLRHCHASQLIAENINIKTICERLGHSTIKITLDTYGHLLPGMDQAAANAVSASF